MRRLYRRVLTVSRRRAADVAPRLVKGTQVGALLMLGFEEIGHLWVGAAAATRDEAAGALDFIERLFPEVEPDEAKPSVSFSVWTDGMSYPNHHTTEVTPWSELASNYPKATRDRLAALTDPSFKAGRDGRLLLLYGPPGTGKSTFIASLAWAWKGWADLQIVSDPSILLADMRYLTRVALSRGPDARWGLVVLEDAGSLFVSDAEQRSGESRLGALLNVGDGILGKTSRALWACTTNLPLEGLHAAVSRPGRCAARIEFTAFPPEEAREWFEAKERPDLAAQVRGELTLAELYGLLARLWLAPPDEALMAQFRVAVTEAPGHAALFALHSRAEVPLIGTVQTPRGTFTVSGQVDRLAVSESEILIVDYKTNRPPPSLAVDVPLAYRRQLALYRALLGRIYPGRKVRAFLLWTAAPLLMEIDAETLDNSMPYASAS